jgi:hypothetical protein
VRVRNNMNIFCFVLSWEISPGLRIDITKQRLINLFNGFIERSWLFLLFWTFLLFWLLLLFWTFLLLWLSLLFCLCLLCFSFDLVINWGWIFFDQCVLLWLRVLFLKRLWFLFFYYWCTKCGTFQPCFLPIRWLINSSFNHITQFIEAILIWNWLMLSISEWESCHTGCLLIR